MKTAKEQEISNLEAIKESLDNSIVTIEKRLAHYHDEVEQQKQYLWENRDEMDHIEKISQRQSIEQSVFTGDKALALKDRLEKLRLSPYFGRFDFQEQGEQALPVYIGVHQYFDENSNEALIYDWRAPIASMFYDFELGEAAYDSPEGKVSGEISLKRQFRIRDGRLDLMLESEVNIMDDLLQEELGRASDEGMKNIVATIQRDQNAIIRNEHAQTLIIQGVAGSGKTSIALHRIAFLLYRFRDTLTSKDILIISPNRVFADYISNVLPELGEETVQEIQMETLADQLLDHGYRFQTFFEQITALQSNRDKSLAERISAKSSAAFLTTLNKYADYVEKQTFQAKDVWLSGRLIPGEYLEETFKKHRGFATTERINRTVRSTEQRVRIEYNYDLMPEDRKQLKQALKEMYKKQTLRATYKGLFEWMGRTELFKQASAGRLEYADVFPLIYLKMRLEGKSRVPWRTKHLLIDEMQDYSPVQYAVIEHIFKCKKTILGDANQSINPHSASDVEAIRAALFQSVVVKLNKSYRSTWEITRFAQEIQPDPDLEAMKRHGDKPRIHFFKKNADELLFVTDHALAFADSDFHSLGIICKTQKQAEKVARQMEEQGINYHLLTELSSSFSTGIVICTAHMAKGLEFDQVLVFDASDKNYHMTMDRHLLYVACTRAMHDLALTVTGQASSFLPGEDYSEIRR